MFLSSVHTSVSLALRWPFFKYKYAYVDSTYTCLLVLSSLVLSYGKEHKLDHKSKIHLLPIFDSS